MDKFSYLSNADVSTVESLYQQYQQDPGSVDEGWARFFEGFDFAKTSYDEENPVCEPAVFIREGHLDFDKEFKVYNLINAYRIRGHLFTKTNPVRDRRKYFPTLEIQNFGLSRSDLDKKFQAGFEIGLKNASLQEIIDKLTLTYCNSIGVEYMYLRKPEKLEWLQKKMEGSYNSPDFSNEEKKYILHKLNQAVVFEQFLHKKFVGQKRFSLEGGESLIPALDVVIEYGSELGIKEFVVGMAHRGRLNVLANIFHKSYENIFNEFEGKEYEDNLFDGDVKYHLGYSNVVKTNNGNEVKMTLAPNPSHLEAVDAIVEGISRAKIDNYLKDEGAIAPILIHGDASISGQGMVYEIIQMAALDGYRTGGTIHIVINNQIGFTTNYLDGRSSTYCTDVAKVTMCPVFHVNGDDPEAVAYVMKLALEFRQKYNKDVFIDLLCYRKYGHNEGDEPRFTQPILYKAIAKHKNSRDIYLNRLIEEGVTDAESAKKMEKEFYELLQERLETSKQFTKASITNFMENTWEDIRSAKAEDFESSVGTAYAKKRLLELGKKITELPENKTFFKKTQKLIGERRKMIEETQKLDWGMAELMAYASLLDEGYPVRISGQDSERGTFSHRHAVLTVEDSEDDYVPLANIKKDQPMFSIYNSLLSEYGVLGFDYGYSMASPNTLTVWEAQFGDFNNGAQIIIDQFLSSAEDKWKSKSGIVLFLPHGYEGQGAEHSSGRMERYLSLCADNNIQVANCTTPANFYHLLRRQMKREFRKPLVVFTPKSLLRHPKVVSDIDELAEGKFSEIIDDENAKIDKVKTLAFCSGKIYYDLLEKFEEYKVDDIALVRLEQIYPFPKKQFDAILDKYKNAEKTLWVQEEPENMGAWTFILNHTRKYDLEVISRLPSASPASGSTKAFQIRQQRVIDKVLAHSMIETE